MSTTEATFTGRPARTVRRMVNIVVSVIAGLSFAFGFGNGWTLGLQLGVPSWIAPLVAPAVDLSVAALLVSIQFLRSRGLGGKLIAPRLLLAGCGGATFALNTTRAILTHEVGKACFDAIAPLLLIGWSEVGPRLLLLLHASTATIVPDESGTARTDVVPSAELVLRARELDTERRETAGRPISRDRLRAALGVSNALAGELVRIVRSSAEDGASS